MAYGFVAYIDESGDPSCTGKFRADSTGGQSHFLTLGAYVVRATEDLPLVARRDSILNEIKPHFKKRELHFSDLNHAQKVRYCEMLAEFPARAIAVTVNKAFFVERFRDDPVQLYWYVCRLLVERISWLCDDAEPNPDRKTVRLVFSNRGGMSYDEFRGYLGRLRDIDTQIRWACIDEALVESRAHSQLAGLQFADGFARGVTEAFEPGRYGVLEPRYALLLKRIAYRYRNGRIAKYGLKVLPTPPLGLTDEQDANIRQYCE